MKSHLTQTEFSSYSAVDSLLLCLWCSKEYVFACLRTCFLMSESKGMAIDSPTGMLTLTSLLGFTTGQLWQRCYFERLFQVHKYSHRRIAFQSAAMLCIRGQLQRHDSIPLSCCSQTLSSWEPEVIQLFWRRLRSFFRCFCWKKALNTIRSYYKIQKVKGLRDSA